MISQQKTEQPTSYLSTLGSNKKIITKIFNLNDLQGKNKEQKVQSEVNDQRGNVYIGGSKVLTEEILSKYKIKALLTVLDYKTYNKLNLEYKISDIDSVQKHFFVDMSNDSHQNINAYIKNSYEFIDQNLPYMNILVHCNDGLCRSPVIVVSYLMRKFGMGFEDAYQILQTERKEIKINPGFQEQLKQNKEMLQIQNGVNQQILNKVE